MQCFLSEYIQALVGAVDADFQDNYDFDRFGRKKTGLVPKVGMRRYCLNLFGLDLSKAVRRAAEEANALLLRGMMQVQSNFQELEWLYGLLRDDESRKWLVTLMLYRALGHTKVRLPTSTPDYWCGVDRLRSLASMEDVVDLGFQGWVASRMSLKEFGFPLELYSTPAAAHAQFVMQSYRCAAEEEVIEARPGDVVFDCGGCYGDTALYFSHLVGTEGRVFSFEFDPDNLRVWNENMKLNPGLCGRIQLVPFPVHYKTGQLLFVEGNGPGTHVVNEANPARPIGCKTMAIDDFVLQQSLHSVDYIKMDIEGSELAALKGAEQTIRRCVPSLAICVYHRLEDFWMVPKYIQSLNRDYRFYLRHFSIHSEETVLFATAR